MLTAIGSALTEVISWLGEFVTAITDTTDGELSPLLALLGIGCAVSAVMFGVKVIRSLIWGA